MRRAIQWIKRARLGDWLRLLDKLLPHVAIILSGMLVVFFLIDRVNKPMAFMTNEFHKRITFALALMAIYLAVRRISAMRRAERDAYRRRLRQYKSGNSAR
ncbi:MAG: hypothetical protein IJ240_05880 [Clostridia bacterium]|nr:hypothetical protein [Clostridia bacterium]MBR1820054.1 hypothetical protein [Clostridia bacterium]